MLTEVIVNILAISIWIHCISTLLIPVQIAGSRYIHQLPKEIRAYELINRLLPQTDIQDHNAGYPH